MTWTESIAVGDKEFVQDTKTKLGAKAMGRKVIGEKRNYELRESQIPYSPFLPLKSVCEAMKTAIVGINSLKPIRSLGPTRIKEFYEAFLLGPDFH